MKTIDRYIFLELFQLFVLCLAVLMAILVLEKINFITNTAAGSGITGGEVWMLIFFTSPAFIVVTLPLAAMLASLITFSRMSADNEIIAMRACGVSFMRMLAPVALLSAGACALSLWLSVAVVHRGTLLFDSLLTDFMGKKITTAMGERTFYDRFPNTVIYVYQKQPGAAPMDGVFIYDANDAENPRFITAKKGALSRAGGGITLALDDGMIYSAKGEGWRSIKYGRYEMVIGGQAKLPRFVKGERQMSVDELRAMLAAAKVQTEQVLAARTELYKRFSLPFACLVLGLLGAPLGVQTTRGGARGGAGIGVLMIVFNYVLLMVGESLGRSGSLPAPVALWLPNIVMGTLAAWLIYRARMEAGPPSLLLWWEDFRKRLAVYFSREGT